MLLDRIMIIISCCFLFFLGCQKDSDSLDLAEQYKVLFNHDGWCVFSNESKYQDIDEPVSMKQVYGYVDEVADAGCDVLLLSPVLGRIPLWDSEVYPHWKQKKNQQPLPGHTAVEKNYNRAREFILKGHDLLQLSLDRAHERGLDFFVSWRMNECHDAANPDTPIMSDFWKAHPEYQLGDINSPSMIEHTLNFAIKEVREDQLVLLEEIISKYDIDGLELDFMRFPFFFPDEMPFEERSDIMIAHLQKIRNMMDKKQKLLPLCVRVHNELDLVKEMGLDLSRCVEMGLVDMINISSFYTLHPHANIEEFQAEFPDTPLYGEMTQCTQWGSTIEISTETTRKTTREIYQTTAFSFLDRGAEGVSLFNFVYTREYSFGNPGKKDAIEPYFDVLKNITNLDYLATQPKHYLLNEGSGPFKETWQLPKTLEPNTPIHLRMYIADDMEQANKMNRYSHAVLRLQAEETIKQTRVNAYLEETVLEPTFVEGELFEQPYLETLPKTHAYYKDYKVPLNIIESGWNTIKIQLDEANPITIIRTELAMYINEFAI